MDIAEVQTAGPQATEGQRKLYLFVGIERTSKFAVTRLVDKADRRTAWKFLESLLKTVPYRIQTILTDNGIQLAEQPHTYEHIVKILTSEPDRFIVNLVRHMLGLNL